MMTRLTAIAVLRIKHKLAFDDAMFVTGYAQAYGRAPWDGIVVSYRGDTHTYEISG